MKHCRYALGIVTIMFVLACAKWYLYDGIFILFIFNMYLAYTISLLNK